MAAFLVAVVVEVGLRVTTLPRLASLLGVPLASGEPSGEPETMSGKQLAGLPATARRQVRATRRVLNCWPFGDTCLRQALVSGNRLRRLAPSLHIGVAKIEGEIRAHAWLVVSGRVLDPLRAASSYQDLSVPGRENQK
nr:lasso peptide biosynthesis B2 protein [Tessaracoccus sp. OS52]